jgi:hypothetical protein
MTRGVDDSDILRRVSMGSLHLSERTYVFGGLELPEGDIDGDTTLTLGLELVQDPSILEGALAQLGGFLLLESASE